MKNLIDIEAVRFGLERTSYTEPCTVHTTDHHVSKVPAALLVISRLVCA
jgi:hypothetical protein